MEKTVRHYCVFWFGQGQHVAKPSELNEAGVRNNVWLEERTKEEGPRNSLKYVAESQEACSEGLGISGTFSTLTCYFNPSHCDFKQKLSTLVLGAPKNGQSPGV